MSRGEAKRRRGEGEREKDTEACPQCTLVRVGHAAHNKTKVIYICSTREESGVGHREPREEGTERALVGEGYNEFQGTQYIIIIILIIIIVILAEGSDH